MPENPHLSGKEALKVCSEGEIDVRTSSHCRNDRVLSVTSRGSDQVRLDIDQPTGHGQVYI